MRPAMLLAAFATLVSFAATARPASDEVSTVPLTYQAMPDSAVWGSNTSIQDDPHETLGKLPEADSGVPMQYGAVTLGNGDDALYSYVLYKKPNSDEYAIVFDANNNEDMTDDPVLTCLVDGGALIANTGDFNIECNGRRYPHSLRFNISEGYAAAYSNCCWQGEIPFGRTSLKIALYDTGNGMFDDLGSQRSVNQFRWHDSMGLDFNGDGELEAGTSSGLELVPLSRFLCLRKKCIELNFTDGGRGLTVKETRVPCGNIAVNYKKAKVILLNGGPGVSIYGPKARVPAGTYQLYQYVVQEKDAEGDVWSLWGWQVNRGREINVRQGSTAKFPIAENIKGEWGLAPEPILAEMEMDINSLPPEEQERIKKEMEKNPPPKPRVLKFPGEERRIRPGLPLEFTLGFSGSMGERIPEICRNGHAEKPAVQISDAAGKEVFKAQGEFG